MSSLPTSADALLSPPSARAATRPSAQAGRISGLDGLRAISILIVFISHYSPLVFPSHPWLVVAFPGRFGVAIFFVISGFLICRLLLDEYARRGDISLRDFYARRILRLSPALMVYVLFFLAAYSLVDGKVDLLAFASAATYTSNYYQSYAGGELYYMPVWSLAIEEHFYLIFPAALLAMLNRNVRVGLAVFVAFLVLSLVWRGVVAKLGLYSFEQIYRNTDTRLDAPMFGVVLALAIWFFPRSRLVTLATSWPGALAALALLAASIVIRDEFLRMTLRYTLQGLSIMLAVAYIVHGPDAVAARIRAFLDMRPFVVLGQLSYSLYLWHLTLLMFVKHVHPSLTPLQAALVGVLSVGAALASYHLVERPFVGLRRRFGSHATA